jgi:peptidoglycan/LPS O-acetylase OafA/YrhL
MNRRLIELDSLRGLAALSVVLTHFISTTPIKNDFIGFTPLRIFWGGHEAVILFFILSGFVLSLPFYKGNDNYYPSYVIKRIFRIYVPYMAAIVLALTVSTLVAKRDLSGLSEWINGYWAYPTTFGSIVQHAFLIFDFDTRQLDPVIWSLVQEMRISLLFPLIMVLVVRLNWKSCIAFAAGLSLVSVLNRVLGIDESVGYFTSYIDTFHYVSMFIFGALLAKNVDHLKNSYIKLSNSLKITLGLMGIVFYTSVPIVEYIFRFSGNYIISDWAISAGVVLIIISVLGTERISKMLHKRAFVLCGDLSYSIYLYHLIILIALTNSFYGVINIYWIYALTLILTFIISGLSWKFIEKPSMNLGKKLSISLGKKRFAIKEQRKTSA